MAYILINSFLCFMLILNSSMCFFNLKRNKEKSDIYFERMFIPSFYSYGLSPNFLNKNNGFYLDTV